MNFFEGSTYSAICMYIFMLYVMLCYVCFPFEPGASFIQIVGSFSSYLEPLNTFFVGSFESCEEFRENWEFLSMRLEDKILWVQESLSSREVTSHHFKAKNDRTHHQNNPKSPTQTETLSRCWYEWVSWAELSRGQFNQRAANSRKTENLKTDQFNASIISCRNTALFRARYDTKQGSLLIRWKH